MVIGSYCSFLFRFFEIDGDVEVIDLFLFDFGCYERVNRWKGMLECDEFVGVRYKSRKFLFVVNIENVYVIFFLLIL